MEKINFIPRGSYILVTSNLVKKEASNLFQGKQSPEIKEIQQVIAVGPEVKDIEVGDWVLMNMNNFIQTVKKASTIRAGVGGMDMLSEQIVIPFFSIPGDETVYIKINSREIEGIIPNYDLLPEVTKEFKSLKDFTLDQERLDKESKDVMKKGIIYKEGGDIGVLLHTETGSGKIKMN